MIISWTLAGNYIHGQDNPWLVVILKQHCCRGGIIVAVFFHENDDGFEELWATVRIVNERKVEKEEQRRDLHITVMNFTFNFYSDNRSRVDKNTWERSGV